MTTCWINFTWVYAVIHKLLCPRCATLSMGTEVNVLTVWVSLAIGDPRVFLLIFLFHTHQQFISLFSLRQTHFPYPPAAVATWCTLPTVVQSCCHCEEIRGWKHGLCQDGGFCPGQQAGAAMGHRSPLSQLLSYSSVVVAAQQKSESGFKSEEEEAFAVQAVCIAQTIIPYLLWIKTN